MWLRACQIDELARLVLNICALVPDGIVIFFPSYHYEQQVRLPSSATRMGDHPTPSCFPHLQVISAWKASGMLAKINAKKKVGSLLRAVVNTYRMLSLCCIHQVFREPKKSSMISQILEEYKATIETNYTSATSAAVRVFRLFFFFLTHPSFVGHSGLAGRS